MSSRALLIHVTGRVQGVAFRHHTKLVARELGLSGWVRNLDDGRVEVRAEGGPAELERLLAWLRRGPPAADVEDVAAAPVAPESPAGFFVRRD